MATPANAATAKSGSVISENEGQPQSHKPAYTRFSQQELQACKPLMTPERIIATFMIVGVILIPIGIAALVASTGVVELVHRYGHECLHASASEINQRLSNREERIQFIQNRNNPKNCTRKIHIHKHMKHPIYVYYEINNFHQNHRHYVKSKNELQLQGKHVTAKDLAKCAPEDYVGNLAILPCGLVAWSLFNDTYSVTLNNVTLPVNKKGIAWKSDLNKIDASVKASNFQNNNDSAFIGGAKLPEDASLKDNEDLWVWMRVAALPRFRKLWGKIEQDLHSGDELLVDIQNLYNCFGFNGEKKLVLSTTSWMGGKNDFLGAAYMTVGLLCVMLAIAFFLMYFLHPRALGDTNQFSWNTEKHNKERLS